MNELCSRWKEVYLWIITGYEMALEIINGCQSTIFLAEFSLQILAETIQAKHYDKVISMQTDNIVIQL